MSEIFITLEAAAGFEKIGYETIKKRMQRSPTAFKTKTQPREGGGKDMVLIAVSSLSAKARREYKLSVKLNCEGVLESKAKDAPPWYVDVDLNWYIENNKEAYYKAIRGHLTAPITMPPAARCIFLTN